MKKRQSKIIIVVVEIIIVIIIIGVLVLSAIRIDEYIKFINENHAIPTMFST